VTRKDFPHGDVTIRVIEVKNLGYTMAPDQCRAWLEVRKGSAVLKQFYYNDIEPVPDSYGIFAPKQQAADDYFAAVKAEPRYTSTPCSRSITIRRLTGSAVPML
jgi:hypothetical protein